MSSRRNFILGSGMALAALPVAAATPPPQAAAAAAAPSGAAMDMPRQLTLLAIANEDGSETLGAKTPRGVVDVRRAQARLGMPAPLTVEAMLREGRAAELSRLVEAALRQADPKDLLRDESSIRHGRLFTNPGKIVCVGLNYRRHAEEIGVPAPRVPPLFNKFNNALAAHGCTIELPPPSVAYKFDYETELLIVVGRKARNVPVDDALQYVAGYCTSNDFSARDLQLELPSAQWLLGKSLDKFAPIGPYFVSADQVANPNDLKVETRVNGEVRQSWSTNDFIYNTQQMISYISTFWTLEPGDIIFTGTPHGVIQGYPKDKRVWLKAGDEVVSSVGQLGELRFRLA